MLSHDNAKSDRVIAYVPYQAVNGCRGDYQGGENGLLYMKRSRHINPWVSTSSTPLDRDVITLQLSGFDQQATILEHYLPDLSPYCP